MVRTPSGSLPQRPKPATPPNAQIFWTCLFHEHSQFNVNLCKRDWLLSFPAAFMHNFVWRSKRVSIRNEVLNIHYSIGGDIRLVMISTRYVITPPLSTFVVIQLFVRISISLLPISLTKKLVVPGNRALCCSSACHCQVPPPSTHCPSLPSSGLQVIHR